MKKFLILTLTLFMLVGCDQSPSVETSTTEDETTTIKVEDEFLILVPQVLSKIRGITSDNVDVSLNLNEMEVGLQDIIKEYLTPKDTYYIPGDLLTVEEVSSLLSREMSDDDYAQLLSEDDEALNLGLNPEGDSDFYTTTMIEQDYYIYDAGDYKLDTIGIGIGIDPIYSEGEEVIKEYSNEQLVDEIYPTMAHQLNSFLQTKEEFKDANILIGFFKNSTSSSAVGYYDAYAYKKADQEDIEFFDLEKSEINFPSTEGEELYPNVNDLIVNLDNDLRSYFSEYSGLEANGYFDDNKIYKLKIKINADIFSSLEVKGFVSYIESWLEKNNPNLNIELEINSLSQDPLALIVTGDETITYIY